MPDKDRTWRQIGWNGIQLQVPADWHPAAVYTNYLLFEEQYRPVCALRWQLIKGRFEPDRILKKLQKSLDRPEATLSPWSIPAGWQPHIESFMYQGFRWREKQRNGVGLLLYSRESQRVLLVQLYGNREGQQNPVIEYLLASLREQQQNAVQLWSVFDIRLYLPGEARLTEHEFLPGSFRLQFQLPDSKYTFYRFRPAAELLRRQSLSQFGDKIAKGAILTGSKEPFFAQWQQKTGPGQQLLARIRRKPVYSILRLWQVPENNVILGLRIQSRNNPAQHDLERLCRGYTSC